MGIRCITQSVIHICFYSNESNSQKTSSEREKSNPSGVFVNFSKTSVFLNNLQNSESNQSNNSNPEGENSKVKTSSVIFSPGEKNTDNVEKGNQPLGEPKLSVILNAYKSYSLESNRETNKVNGNSTAERKSVLFNI